MGADEDSFSVRAFLRERRALLVHFSTVMARRDDLLFPADLRRAWSLRDTPLSFSTVLPTDMGPHDPRLKHPLDAQAPGTIGIVVDIDGNDAILTVGSADDGTYFDNRNGNWVSGGDAPDAETCRRSIDDRKTNNEWFVQNYRPIGIFVLPPLAVRQASDILGDRTVAEAPIDLRSVLTALPKERIFSAINNRFVEYHRDTQAWKAIDYDALVAL